MTETYELFHPDLGLETSFNPRWLKPFISNCQLGIATFIFPRHLALRTAKIHSPNSSRAYSGDPSFLWKVLPTSHQPVTLEFLKFPSSATESLSRRPLDSFFIPTQKTLNYFTCYENPWDWSLPVRLSFKA